MRMDFIISNVFSYLMKDSSNIKAMDANQEKEFEMFQIIKRTIDTFQTKFLVEMDELCLKIRVISNRFEHVVLMECFDELFHKETTWMRVIAFFTFTARLCVLQDFDADQIYAHLLTLMKPKLYSFIYTEEILGNTEMSKEELRCIIKNLWYGYVKVIYRLNLNLEKGLLIEVNDIDTTLHQVMEKKLHI